MSSLTQSSSLSLLSDVWQRDLVELVLEVSVSQVSHRQRDMLLRQVGVLLGVLDSDIIVREVSAFNEHRSAPFRYIRSRQFNSLNFIGTISYYIAMQVQEHRNTLSLTSTLYFSMFCFGPSDSDLNQLITLYGVVWTM